jgi:hypothetical protein
MSELPKQGVAWSCPNCAELERERDQLLIISRASIARGAEFLAENRALREALRKAAIVFAHGRSGCRICQVGWDASDLENHAPGCLAAPQEPAQEGER